MSRPLHRAKRWLYLVHRWIGIATCLLLAMWVFSGLVMLYVPYPSLTQAERMEGLGPINWTVVLPQPPTILRADSSGSPRAFVLEQGLDGPVWRIRSDQGEKVISARTGDAEGPVDRAGAREIAARFARAGVTGITEIERDQWTVGNGFDRFRPLWKVETDTADGRVLYISKKTGAVVQDTRRIERFWNWIGSVPHWLYPTILRQHQPLWRQVVLWTSGAGIIGVVSGMWIGILRARFRRRYKGGRIIPYRGWQYWHHVLGLVGGTLLTTWIVSGWLSVDPGRWFASPGIPDEARAAYAGAAPMPAIDWRKLAALSVARDARRMRLLPAAGRIVMIFEGPGSARAALDGTTLMPLLPGKGDLVRRARLLMPGYAVASAEMLTHADNYWYEAKGAVALPVLRVKFDDPARTWVHIDPVTGELLGDVDARRRIYRWVYDGLHRWDMQGLVTRRPLWDMWMWVWSIAGAIVSVSGVVIGWRRLKPVARPSAALFPRSAAIPPAADR